MPVTPFELLVVVRNQLGDKQMLRTYRAMEAAMVALAELQGSNREQAALAGLGCGIDARLCMGNPQRLGVMARELLTTEGVAKEIAESVFLFRQAETRELDALGAQLVVANGVVEQVLLLREDPDFALQNLAG